MHELFTNVLSKRDLSRAGDLFSVADSDIVNDLSELLKIIDTIISHPDYLSNKNDQSVIEICMTRITSCIRETKTAERHCADLVSLLESCLKYNLQPNSRNEDPPHAKICADIISCIFLNYDKKPVMDVALPTAVKCLQKGNKELSKNLASYLSLAAINNAYVLSPHGQIILDSVISGNYGLCAALPQIYKVSPDLLSINASVLIGLLPKCDIQEKLALLSLFELIAQNKPIVLENCLTNLCEFLMDPLTVTATMMILLKMAENHPNSVHEHFDKIKAAAKTNPSNIALAAKILSAAGKVNKQRAQYALDFIIDNTPYTDRKSQSVLQSELTKLCSTYPILFTDKVLTCIRNKNNMNSQKQQNVNQTSGGVTIVKLNSSSVTDNSAGGGAQSAGKIANVTTTVINTSNGTSSNNTTNSPVSGASQSHPNHNNSNSNNSNYSNNVPNVPHSLNHHANVTLPISLESKSAAMLSHAENSNHHQNSTGVVPPTPPHTGYTRRAKIGDSRSTGRLHSGSNTHRSMTRLNIAGGSVGGLHKSMTRLSSSQQINQNGSQNIVNHSNGSVSHANGSGGGGGPSNGHHNNYATSAGPPASSNVIITGHNRWGTPSKITSGGVTVTTSPPRIRPHSQGPCTLMGSNGGLGRGSSNGLSILNQSTGSIGLQQNPVSVHHASPASPTFSGQQSVMTLPVNLLSNNNHNQVSISGPLTVTSRRIDNTSVTLLNANNTRMSVFEPYPMRDTIQHFCEKHLDKIKSYMKGISQRLPIPIKIGIEEYRSKKIAKLLFACQARGTHCLYSKKCFTMITRNPRTWIHLMFLNVQAGEPNALSSRDVRVSKLRHCWETLKCENKTFMTLVTSAFPVTKDQETLVTELRNSGFFDVLELGPVNSSTDTITEETPLQWGCFICSHPDKAMGLLNDNTQPVIEGQLKEKKGKWRFFRRWRTRYFTLSGARLSCRGSSGGESIDINQIRSVKVSRGARNIPKAFEIFTGDQTLILKPKDGKNAEEWVQYLNIVVAHSQATDTPTTRTNSLPARGIGNSRNAF